MFDLKYYADGLWYSTEHRGLGFGDALALAKQLARKWKMDVGIFQGGLAVFAVRHDCYDGVEIREVDGKWRDHAAVSMI